MPNTDLSRAKFRKSTHSDGGEGCVEAAMLDGLRLVRDSKDPHGPVLAFSGPEWAVFIDGAKSAAFDLP